jgi:hypothetical protein
LSIPRSETLIASLHEAGILSDPSRILKVTIIAECGSAVRVVTETVGTRDSLDVITRELAPAGGPEQ